MLVELDRNRMANMTAAQDAACKKIPTDKDSREMHKRIAMVAWCEGRKSELHAGQPHEP